MVRLHDEAHIVRGGDRNHGRRTQSRVLPKPSQECLTSIEVKIGEKEQEKTFSARDQFGAQITYFSDCILKRRDPEPSGEEGLIDVRIVEALYQSARSGKPVRLPKFPKKPRPSLKQELKLPPVKKPDVIATDAPYD